MDILDDIFNLKIPINGIVQYKILDSSDENMQGLFRQAQLVSISRKGLEILMKEKVVEKDIMLVKMNLNGEKTEIKASCMINSCVKLEKEKSYKTDLEFIILKSDDARKIIKFIDTNLKKMIKIP